MKTTTVIISTIIILLCVIAASLVFSAHIYEGLESDENPNGSIPVSQLINMDYAIQNYTNGILDKTLLITNLKQLHISNPTITNLINKKDINALVATNTNTMNKLEPKTLFSERVPVYTESD